MKIRVRGNVTFLHRECHVIGEVGVKFYYPEYDGKHTVVDVDVLGDISKRRLKNWGYWQGRKNERRGKSWLESWYL